MFILPLIIPYHLAPAGPFVALPQDENGSRLGRAVLTLHDLNGDGQPEFAAGAPAAGYVFVVDGMTREVLARWDSKEPAMFGFTLAAILDADGDSQADVIVGFERHPVTEIRSSATGALLASIQAESKNVHDAGDVNGDGVGDVLVQAGKEWSFRSAKGGEEVFAFRAEHAAPILPVGDLNGDGVVDGIQQHRSGLLVTSRREDERITYDSAPAPGLDGGRTAVWNTASAADFNGDGTLDVLVAATPPSPTTEIRVISGGENAFDFRLSEGPSDGFAGDPRGYVLMVAGDLDGDGKPDVIVPDRQDSFQLTVRAYSPATGAELWKSTWPDGGALSGVSLAPYADADRDGVPDVLVGSSDYHWHGTVRPSGCVLLLSGATGKPLWRLNEVDTKDGALFSKSTRWRHRLLVVAGTPEARGKQIARLKEDEAGSLERRIVVLELVEGEEEARVVLGELPFAPTEAFVRRRFEIARLDFEMVLVGLDGGAKEYYFAETSPKDVWKVIDVMPMRRREIEDR